MYSTVAHLKQKLKTVSGNYSGTNTSILSEMEFIWFVSLILLFYTICYIVSQKFKVKNSSKSLDFPQKPIIEIGMFTCKWSTGHLNFWFPSLTRKYHRFIGYWYHWGTALTSLLFIPSCLILTYSALQSIRALLQDTKEEEVLLQPVLPGVNIPKNELLLYLVSIFISTLVHEFGHATAAARENISVIGVGIFVMVIFPAAFVELPTAQLTSLSPWNQLKIYCAGVWHNTALAFFAYGILRSSPLLLAPFFVYGDGVSITDLNEYVPGGPHDFQIGDILTHIDGCRLENAVAWRECLTKLSESPPLGFCVDGGYLTEAYFSDASECCVGMQYLQSHQCFVSVSKESSTTYFCLKARQVSESASSRCYDTNDCSATHKCLLPSFSRVSENGTTTNDSPSRTERLMKLNRKNNQPVLFVGTPSDLFSIAQISNFLPRFAFLGSKAAEIFESFLKYIISFSAGLGVLNLVPCYYMDGQHVANTLCELLFRKRLSLSSKKKLTNVATIFGTCIIVINLLCSLCLLFI